MLDTDTGRQVCKKCGFETNSEETFELHKKNCPRIQTSGSVEVLLNKTPKLEVVKYYCLLEDYSCDMGIGEECLGGSAKGRSARDPSKCPYRVRKTW